MRACCFLSHVEGVTLWDYSSYTAVPGYPLLGDPRRFHPDPTSLNCPPPGSGFSFVPHYCARQLFLTYSDLEFRIGCEGGDCTIWAPQPLRSVFVGLRQALDELENRRVSGDGAGLVFFDHELPWTRIVNISSDLSYLKVLADRAYDPDLGSPLALKLGMIPGPQGHTNLFLALEEAVRRFDANAQANPGMTFENNIILTSDGLTTCSPSPSACDNFLRYDFDRDGDVDASDLVVLLANFGATCNISNCSGQCLDPYGNDMCIDNQPTNRDLLCSAECMCQCDLGHQTEMLSLFGLNCSQGCENSVTGYFRGMYELARYVQEVPIPRKITLHVIHVGRQAGPHWFDIDADRPIPVMMRVLARKLRDAKILP